MQNYPTYINQISLTSVTVTAANGHFQRKSMACTLTSYNFKVLATNITKVDTCSHFLFPVQVFGQCDFVPSFYETMVNFLVKLQAFGCESIIILGSCFLSAPKIHKNQTFYNRTSYQQSVNAQWPLVGILAMLSHSCMIRSAHEKPFLLRPFGTSWSLVL